MDFSVLEFHLCLLSNHNLSTSDLISTLSTTAKIVTFLIFLHLHSDSLHALQSTTALTILHPFCLFWPLHKQHPISLSKERSAQCASPPISSFVWKSCSSTIFLMSIVHWGLVLLLTGLSTAQAVLALLAHSRATLPCLLAHAVLCLVTVVAQIFYFFLAKKLPLATALCITVLYAGYIGVSVWVGLVVFREKIAWPLHFTAVQSLLVVAFLIAMASLVTLAWVNVSRQEHDVSDDESMKTVILVEQKTRGGQDSRKTTLSITPQATIAETIRPSPRALAALHNKESQRTLVGMPMDGVGDDSTLNLIYKASLADAALYDSNSGNWMNTMPISYSSPYLGQPRQLVSSTTDSSSGSIWRHRHDDENNLARSSSMGHLRIKKQRLLTRKSMDRLQNADPKERFGSPLRPAHTGPNLGLGSHTGPALLTEFKYNITKAATAKALAQKYGPEKVHRISVPESVSPGSPIFPELENSQAENTPYRFSEIMDGLEDIPRPPQLSGDQAKTLHHSATHQGIQNVSLEEWEASKTAWLSQSHSAKPILYAIASSRTLSSAPSLHTYRQVSEKSTAPSEDMESLEHIHANPVTPVHSAAHFEQPEDSSPIKKMMGMFKRRDSAAEILTSPSSSIPQNHKHTTSVANSLASFSASLASGKSTRSNSPRKSIKSIFTRSVNYDQAPPQRLAFPSGPPGAHNLHRIPQHQSMSLNFKLLPGFLPSHSWEAETVDHSEGSRVSSIPSAVIGEYDKEKWRTLKELGRHSEIGAEGNST